MITLSIIQMSKDIPSYGDYEFSTWAIVCGGLFSFSSVLPIPLFYGYYTIKGWWSRRTARKAAYGEFGAEERNQIQIRLPIGGDIFQTPDRKMLMPTNKTNYSSLLAAEEITVHPTKAIDSAVFV